jgi:hypothetical protein
MIYPADKFHIDAAGRFSRNFFRIFSAVVGLIWGTALNAQTAQSGIEARMKAAVDRQTHSIESMRNGLSAQVKSVANQPGGASSKDPFFVLPPPPKTLVLTPAPECDPLPPERVNDLVQTASEQSAVPPELLRSVMKVESGFRPCALSNKGAAGLMQLMPATAISLGVWNAFDPKENVTAGARYLGQLLGIYGGDYSLALSAYNAGPSRVEAGSAIPNIPETVDYVRKILNLTPAPRRADVEAGVPGE